MFLQKLMLHNFRCFKDIEVNFHPQLTVLAGINGSGKSSLLEGAAIALSSLFIKMSQLSARKIDKEQAHLESFAYGTTRDMQAQYPVIISAEAAMDSNSPASTIRWTRSLSSPQGQTLYREAKEITSLGADYQKRVRQGDTGLLLPLFAYYGTGRVWDYHRRKQGDVFPRNNRLGGYVDCLDGTANVKLMTNWFTKMTVQKYQNQELGIDRVPELEAVLVALENCYRRITGYPETKIQFRLATRQFEVAYRNERGVAMRLPINHLSDGYKCTISLVADIAYRMAVLNPQLADEVCTATEGIVLIDEIDLHLHPNWQARILSDLTEIFPRVQFIVTTHAPSVLNSVKSENVLLLEGREVFSPSDEVHGRDVLSASTSTNCGRQTLTNRAPELLLRLEFP